MTFFPALQKGKQFKSKFYQKAYTYVLSPRMRTKGTVKVHTTGTVGWKLRTNDLKESQVM